MAFETSRGKNYIPHQFKRFAISPDQYSRERIYTIRDMYFALEKTLPGVSIAFTVGGSLAKGKLLDTANVHTTDIDLNIFYNLQEAQENHHLITQNNIGYKGYCIDVHSQRNLQLTHLEDKQQEQLQKTADYSGSLLLHSNSREKDLQSNLISHAMNQYIKTFSEKALDKNRSGMGFLPERDLLDYQLVVSPISIKGKYSILDNLQQLEDAFRSTKENLINNSPEALSFKVYRYFLLDVGGGMKRYIKSFLQELSGLSLQEAEIKWIPLIWAMKERERANQIPLHIKSQYPQTFAEACKLYGIELLPKIEEDS